MNAFVEAYNDAVGTMGDLTRYDSEGESRALLQSDLTLRFIGSDLSRLAMDPVAGLPDALNSLFQVGITLDREGLLVIDESVLESSIASDPDGVLALFTIEPGGLSERFSDRLDYVTRSGDGQIAGAVDRLDSQISSYEDQVERLTVLLEARELRLREEFIRMESALAALQSQNSFFQLQMLGISSSSGGGLSLLG